MPEFPDFSDPSSAAVPELVNSAIAGDARAWRGLVDRFTPLVRAVARRYGLSAADAEDVCQTVWLRVVEHLGEIREPRALPGWIVTVTRNEALRLVSGQRRTVPIDPQVDPRLDQIDHADVADNLLHLEVRQTVRSGVVDLQPRHRDLLLLFLDEPEMSYGQISDRLGMPHGSIGPTRARSLEKLQANTAIRALAS